MHQREDLHTPVVIIGSGIAGLLTALKLAEGNIAVTVVTKTELTENSSRYAQGGIAAVLPNQSHDSLEAHVQDTLNAGAGLSNEAITRSILADAPYVIDDLLALGVPFDRVEGQLAFTKEAAHTHARILHAGGDATGRSIQDTLTQHVKAHPRITVFEQCTALSLLTDEDNRCGGVRVAHTKANAQGDMAQWHTQTIHAPYTIVATGGVGRLYAQTTNPVIATGDGVALAYQAGARVQDMEFVQFHPTAFWAPDDTKNGSVRFLISEALRGEGAILRNAAGEAYAKSYHPDGELAPRDIVTRLIWSEMAKSNQPHSYLDISHLPTAHLEQRFPTILQSCLSFGIDIRKDWIPVAPAAHYAMGGVFVDAQGQTSIPGLMAVGEVVCSQLHGANRLASNSLLECVVLARRVAEHVVAAVTQDDQVENATYILDGAPSARIMMATDPEDSQDWPLLVETLRSMMWQHAGIIRDEEGLQVCRGFIRQAQAQLQSTANGPDNPAWVSVMQMLTTSALIVDAALDRCESRGAHYRSDYPALLPEAKHSTQQRHQRPQHVTNQPTRLQPV